MDILSHSGWCCFIHAMADFIPFQACFHSPLGLSFVCQSTAVWYPIHHSWRFEGQVSVIYSGQLPPTRECPWWWILFVCRHIIYTFLKSSPRSTTYKVGRMICLLEWLYLLLLLLGWLLRWLQLQHYIILLTMFTCSCKRHSSRVIHMPSIACTKNCTCLQHMYSALA